MDISDHIQSAGRAVLDMMEREWEPLCQSELEQRLDQAVEEMLEADLVAKVRAETATVYLQLVPAYAQSQTSTELQVSSTTEATTMSDSPHYLNDSPEEEEPGFQETLATVDSNAIKHIADLLQNSKSKHRVRLAGRARLSLSHTVLLSLALLSKRITYRSVSNRFRLEKGNIHRIFFSFCERVNMLEKEQIRWPVESESIDGVFPLSNLLGKSERLEDQCVPTVLGVLGHTHIPIRLPRGGQDMESTAPEVKRMKKDAHPDSYLNLELVCDGKGRFLHCRISKGSDMDKASTLRARLEQHPELMAPGSCLVARAGYPLTAQILTPYVACDGARENLFNKTLEDHFNILDQAIADLKARFQRLRHLDTGNYERARAVVLTTCILHNVFLDIGQVVKGEVEEEGSIQEGEGETDDGGINRREAISDLLYKELDSRRT